MLFCLYTKHCYTIIINVIYNTIVSCDMSRICYIIATNKCFRMS